VSDSGAAKVIAREAYRLGSAIYDVTRLKYGNVVKTLDYYGFDAEIYGTAYNGVKISMIGEHQIQNALTALTAMEVLRKNGIIKINRADILAGLAKARQIVRFEVFGSSPYIIIDGAHNEKGAEALKATMKEHFAGKKVLIALGMLADKDAEGILSHLFEIADDYIATEPDNPRKLPAAALADKIRKAGKNCVFTDKHVSACEKALELAEEYDAVLFTGSLYLLGKIRGVINERYKTV
jgi:dihydrofolate synthase/folylpolyglutamate synthase